MRDELDNLIDGALATYSTAEPLAGLEQRVLDRVRLAQARRRRWFWGLGLAVPAVAAATLVILAPKPKPVPVPVAVVKTPPAPVVLPTRPGPQRVAAKSRRQTARPELPKRNLFPTISPLTDQERLLIQVARSTPELLLAMPSGDIEIKPIEIAPLQIDGLQQGDTKQ